MAADSPRENAASSLENSFLSTEAKTWLGKILDYLNYYSSPTEKRFDNLGYVKVCTKDIPFSSFDRIYVLAEALWLLKGFDVSSNTKTLSGYIARFKNIITCYQASFSTSEQGFLEDLKALDFPNTISKNHIKKTENKHYRNLLFALVHLRIVTSDSHLERNAEGASQTLHTLSERTDPQSCIAHCFLGNHYFTNLRDSTKAAEEYYLAGIKSAGTLDTHQISRASKTCSVARYGHIFSYAQFALQSLKNKEPNTPAPTYYLARLYLDVSNISKKNRLEYLKRAMTNYLAALRIPTDSPGSSPETLPREKIIVDAERCAIEYRKELSKISGDIAPDILNLFDELEKVGVQGAGIELAIHYASRASYDKACQQFLQSSDLFFARYVTQHEPEALDALAQSLFRQADEIDKNRHTPHLEAQKIVQATKYLNGVLSIINAHPKFVPECKKKKADALQMLQKLSKTPSFAELDEAQENEMNNSRSYAKFIYALNVDGKREQQTVMQDLANAGYLPAMKWQVEKLLFEGKVEEACKLAIWFAYKNPTQAWFKDFFREGIRDKKGKKEENVFLGICSELVQSAQFNELSTQTSSPPLTDFDEIINALIRLNCERAAMSIGTAHHPFLKNAENMILAELRLAIQKNYPPSFLSARAPLCNISHDSNLFKDCQKYLESCNGQMDSQIPKSYKELQKFLKEKNSQEKTGSGAAGTAIEEDSDSFHSFGDDMEADPFLAASAPADNPDSSEKQFQAMQTENADLKRQLAERNEIISRLQAENAELRAAAARSADTSVTSPTPPSVGYTEGQRMSFNSGPASAAPTSVVPTVIPGELPPAYTPSAPY